MRVRKARLQDATNIYDLVNSLSHDGTLLRRVLPEICENVRDFTVAETEAGVFLGCGALPAPQPGPGSAPVSRLTAGAGTRSTEP